jgi:hypothetical protein
MGKSRIVVEMRKYGDNRIVGKAGIPGEMISHGRCKVLWVVTKLWEQQLWNYDELWEKQGLWEKGGIIGENRTVEEGIVVETANCGRHKV